MEQLSRHPSSYRDPSGFIFSYNNTYYRQVNKSYADDYEFFMEALYPSLLTNKQIIAHREVEAPFQISADAYKILLPEQLRFISYPYEWSFHMLKDAALLTLDIQKTAMEKGMTLKDATPFNVQWVNGRMVFIDTLSFERYDPLKPWIAYRQFCETFLAPLALMHYSGKALYPLLLAYPEGIPLGISSALLPFRSRLRLHIYLHIHLHAGYSAKRSSQPTKAFSKQKLMNVIDSLRSAVAGLELKEKTVWAEYYREANERNDYVDNKKRVIGEWTENLASVNTVLDLGGNNGTFSAIFEKKGMHVVCADSDHFSIDNLYQNQASQSVHPLLIDFSNPSPPAGFNNSERMSFLQRAKSDLVLALALIHHLCIGKNLPLEDVARSLASIATTLIIEFVPKEDKKVQEMLENKEDIYQSYHQAGFENAFSAFFNITRSVPLESSLRTLYLMERKPDENR